MSLSGAAFSSCGSAFTHVTSAAVSLLFLVDVEVFVGVIATGLCSVMRSCSESCSVRCEYFLCAVYVSSVRFSILLYKAGRNGTIMTPI